MSPSCFPPLFRLVRGSAPSGIQKQPSRFYQEISYQEVSSLWILETRILSLETRWLRFGKMAPRRANPKGKWWKSDERSRWSAIRISHFILWNPHPVAEMRCLTGCLVVLSLTHCHSMPTLSFFRRNPSEWGELSFQWWKRGSQFRFCSSRKVKGQACTCKLRANFHILFLLLILPHV